MLSLIFGLTAACAWAVHDLLVRKLGQAMPLLPMMLVVLCSGAVALVGPALLLGDVQATSPAMFFAVAAGLAYAVGMGGLYRAFSLAPVRLVAPILGAYPMISLALAAAQGRSVSGLEILAVVAVVGGIALVAMAGKAEGAVERPGQAVLWSVAGSIGFAATFWLGQEAARLGSALPMILLTRVSALLVIGVLAAVCRANLSALRGNVRILVGMGVLDALALGLVTASARLAHPEYAAISSSLFGVLTILLAWRVLGEAVRPLQWLGITAVFAAIAVLSTQG